jgi:hypothetical protein
MREVELEMGSISTTSWPDGTRIVDATFFDGTTIERSKNSAALAVHSCNILDMLMIEYRRKAARMDNRDSNHGIPAVYLSILLWSRSTWCGPRRDIIGLSNKNPGLNRVDSRRKNLSSPGELWIFYLSLPMCILSWCLFLFVLPCARPSIY